MKYVLDTLEVGPLGANCYILGCARTKEAAVIDPGGDAELIKSRLAANGLTAKCIVLTHGHYDHIGAVQHLGLPVFIHKADAGTVAGCNRLDDADTVKVGDLSLEVIHTPGHSRGSICLKCGDIVFSGDTLFAGGVGRTDLGGGSQEQLEASLAKLVSKLDDGTAVYPGHGPPTTIGAEKQENPFL